MAPCAARLNVQVHTAVSVQLSSSSLDARTRSYDTVKRLEQVLSVVHVTVSGQLRALAHRVYTLNDVMECGVMAVHHGMSS